MERNKITVNGAQHTILQCGTCAVWHTIPAVIHDTYYREGGFWHCPNGHQRGYRKGQDAVEAENMRRERDRLKQDTARLQDELAATRKRAEEAESKVVKTKRRANAGVCQCCNRTFLNVQRHMKSKHPNVVPLECKSA